MGLVEHPSNRLSELVIGAAIEVHRWLGPGLLESSYQRCLAHELRLRGVEHRCEVSLPLRYKGIVLESGYVVDVNVEDLLLVELKAVERLLPVHAAQLMTYMRMSRISAGLLINFNVPTLRRGGRRMLL